MRSIPVVDEGSIALARSYDGIADWLLLDSYESGDRQVGALGVTHSWELDRRIIESVRIPAIIAGGLAAGVDSKTKPDKSDGSHTRLAEGVGIREGGPRPELCHQLASRFTRRCKPC